MAGSGMATLMSISQLEQPSKADELSYDTELRQGCRMPIPRVFPYQNHCLPGTKEWLS